MKHALRHKRRRNRVELGARINAVMAALDGMKAERQLILLDTVAVGLRQRIVDEADDFVREVDQALA